MTGDKATVMVTVPCAPQLAFDTFTRETDLWWQRTVKYRVAGREPGTIAFEPKLGGRLFEQYEGPAGTRVHEAGTITAWEPPSRLAFDWRGSNFEPGEVTHVQVTFVATESGNTQVTVEHRGFAALRPDHPVRHGQDAASFIHGIGRWWGGLLGSFREKLS